MRNRFTRFPILEFRIPNSVWRMGILEYRTMRSWGAGGGGGSKGFLYHWSEGGGSDTGCPIPIAGVGHWMSDGSNPGEVLNRKRPSDKEGTDTLRGMIGLLGKESGKRQAASPRKEGQAGAGVHTLWATKNPAGVNLRGVVMGLWFTSRYPLGR